jgi:predicted nucleotide-binding protein
LRARQNVVFELGYFLASLGSKRVCALLEPGVERPSHIDGLLYIDLKAAGWRFELAREMKAAGLPVDMNKAL